MMFAMITPTACLSPSIAIVAAAAVACFLVFMTTVTLLGFKLINKAITSHVQDASTTMTNNNGKLYFDQFGAVDVGFVEGCGDAGFFTGNGFIAEGWSSGNDFHAVAVDGFLDEAIDIRPLSTKVPTTTATSVHFALKDNQVHEITHITEYSQEEKESCWYSREQFGEMRTSAFIANLVGPSYDNHNFLESGVPAVIFIPSVLEEKNKTPSRFVGPTFVEYREPRKNDDFDEDEASTTSCSTDDDMEVQGTASTDDDVEVLLNANSKLSLEETSSKTASDDFESSMAELVDSFAKL